MEKELRILMLEDIEEDAALVDYALKKDKFVFTRVRVDTREQFTEALDSFHPDIILSDHSLPQFNSFEALKICQGKKLDTPFILVTGSVSEEFAVTCLKRGADDYVLKTNLSRLPLAIRFALRQHRYESNRQLQEEVLRQQNEQLIKINKELDSFVYSVSHDLRSPLSSILGLVNIAKLEGFRNPEMLNTYFEMIERSVLKLDDTIKEILDYSRNARGELTIEEIDVEKMIHNAFSQLQYLPGYDGTKKQVNVHNHSALYSDAYRLSVILLNLISNSLKYGDDVKDQKIIQVTATITPAHCTLQVHDNGIGVHSDYIDNVFKMFYRATDRSQGAGLGLYIVKEMIEKLAGTISITSELGKGTVITISIPNKLMLE
jgi:signal transduction histidine kinase